MQSVSGKLARFTGFNTIQVNRKYQFRLASLNMQSRYTQTNNFKHKSPLPGTPFPQHTHKKVSLQRTVSYVKFVEGDTTLNRLKKKSRVTFFSPLPHLKLSSREQILSHCCDNLVQGSAITTINVRTTAWPTVVGDKASQRQKRSSVARTSTVRRIK